MKESYEKKNKKKNSRKYYKMFDNHEQKKNIIHMLMSSCHSRISSMALSNLKYTLCAYLICKKKT